MNRRDLLEASAVAIPAAATSIVSAPAIAKGKIQWKLATSFPAKAPGVGTNVTSFAKRVNEMSGGRLTLKVYSSGELVPPFSVENAVQQGTVEIGHSTPYYSASKNSAIHFFSAVPFGLTAVEHAAWLRYGGGQELWDKIYAERGLVPFYSGNSGIQSAGWFKKEVKSLSDLSGLNMRIAGLGGEVMRKVGVNAVLLPPPEIFPAFKSGAIDAAEWVGPMLDQAFGLNKVANYCYLPAFHEPSAALEIVVNKEAYDSLPADLQAIVANAAEATSAETLSQFDYFNTLAFKKLKDSGVVFSQFPDDVISALHKGAAEVMAENAKANPAFAEVQKSYEAYQSLAAEYANAMKVPSFQQRT